MNETALLVTIRDAIAREPGVLLWRNNAGKLQDARGRWVTYGLGVGGADLVGLVECGGFVGRDSDPIRPMCFARFFALEVKTDKGRMRPEQECWSRAVHEMGGFCATVRSVEDAMGALVRCRQGATE